LKTTPSAPVVPPESGLYLDDKGHVWVDGEPVTPPLSELEFRLLKALSHQAPEIVPHIALIEIVWPSSMWSDSNRKAYDEQNLRKLIARLRDRLEPGVQGNRSRFIKNVRGRGYWLKVC
jgi:DNA-binding winged helix-turn-helix (wHTH) protein